jgi:pyruvate dehydrogenase phosphatase
MNQGSQKQTGAYNYVVAVHVFRSIGDVYLKNAKYNTDQIEPKFRLPESFSKRLMSADPSIISRNLEPNDCFIILVSDGLWEHLSNQEADSATRSFAH